MGQKPTVALELIFCWPSIAGRGLQTHWDSVGENSVEIASESEVSICARCLLSPTASPSPQPWLLTLEDLLLRLVSA